MSYSAGHYAKLGAYSNPFSGQGVSFHPLGVRLDCATVLLHEAGFLPTRPHWNYSNVFSPFWRLYFDMQSGHSVVLADKKVELGPDRLVLIPDHQMFQTVGAAPRAKFWLHFTCTRRVTPKQAIPIILRLSPGESAVVHELIGRLRAKKKDQQQILHGSLALLHLTLSRPEIEWLEEKPSALQQAILHVEQHYRQPLSNPELAKLTHLSERSLTRQFLRYQGVSPRNFIMQVRVRAAADLMLNTRASLAEIAEKTGFPNRAYFTRVFTHITGEPPALFRRTHAQP